MPQYRISDQEDNEIGTEWAVDSFEAFKKLVSAYWPEPEIEAYWDHWEREKGLMRAEVLNG